MMLFKNVNLVDISFVDNIPSIVLKLVVNERETLKSIECNNIKTFKFMCDFKDNEKTNGYYVGELNVYDIDIDKESEELSRVTAGLLSVRDAFRSKHATVLLVDGDITIALLCSGIKVIE